MPLGHRHVADDRVCAVLDQSCVVSKYLKIENSTFESRTSTLVQYQNLRLELCYLGLGDSCVLCFMLEL